ncbi:MAG: hypothetical protein HY064_09640 [Bacteroidetes bacterium]|nr:hypothetical protein [Bacteroidota bacterium]
MSLALLDKLFTKRKGIIPPLAILSTACLSYFPHCLGTPICVFENGKIDESYAIFEPGFKFSNGHEINIRDYYSESGMVFINNSSDSLVVEMEIYHKVIGNNIDYSTGRAINCFIYPYSATKYSGNIPQYFFEHRPPAGLKFERNDGSYEIYYWLRKFEPRDEDRQIGLEF